MRRSVWAVPEGQGAMRIVNVMSRLRDHLDWDDRTLAIQALSKTVDLLELHECERRGHLPAEKRDQVGRILLGMVRAFDAELKDPTREMHLATTDDECLWKKFCECPACKAKRDAQTTGGGG